MINVIQLLKKFIAALAVTHTSKKYMKVETGRKKYFPACGPPPAMVNGTFSGPTNPRIGTVVRYACKEGFFAHGKNHKEFETECLENRTYTKYSIDLAACYFIS